MNSFWEFAANHEGLAFLLVLLAAITVCAFFRWCFCAFNRIMRHLNIKVHGWPPPHCDADGDFKPEESE